MSSLSQANGFLTARSQVRIAAHFTHPGSLSFTDLSPYIWLAVKGGGVKDKVCAADKTKGQSSLRNCPFGRFGVKEILYIVILQIWTT